MVRSCFLLSALALLTYGCGQSAHTAQAQDDDVVIDHQPALVLFDGFDGESLIANDGGTGPGFFGFDGAGIVQVGKLGMNNADADYAASLANGMANFSIRDGATWTFEVALTDILVTQDSVPYADMSIDIGLVSVHGGKAGFLAGRYYNTTGGFFTSFDVERENSDSEVSVFGGVDVASKRKVTDCYTACAGMEDRAKLALGTLPANRLTVTITVDANGWVVAFDQSATVSEGALSGAWSDLTDAALSDELDDGVFLQLFAQNSFQARASCAIDSVRVTRTP